MPEITIRESIMEFGPMPETHILRLEECSEYQRIQQGVPIAEFSYFKENGVKRIYTIEAKQSSPRSENEPDFSTYIRDIALKLSNGFQLSYALILRRFDNSSTALPSGMSSIDLATVEHRLVLVIKGHEKTWLPPIQEALRQELKALEKLWNLGPNAIAVINDEIARHMGLIK
jgi:hypothetical protein